MCLSRVGCTMFAATTRELGAQSGIFIHTRKLHWPASADPTPYEIFNMTPATFDKKRLNKIYIQLAKKYHPDIISDSDSAKDTSERFKKVVAAHEILKDDHQRRIWDIRHGVGNSEFGAPHHPFGQHPGYCYRPTHGASSWHGQEFHHTYPSGPEFEGFWSEERKQRHNANLHDNRMWLLKVVIGSVIFVAVCEFFAVVEVSDRRTAQLDRITRDTEELYARILANFDRGNSSEDRIQRFIEHRQRTLDKYPKASYLGITEGRSRDPADYPSRTP